MSNVKTNEVVGVAGGTAQVTIRRLRVDELEGYTNPNIISIPPVAVAMYTPWIDVYALYGEKTASAVLSAISDIGATKATMFLDDGDWNIDNNVTLAATTFLRFGRGAVLTIANGMTLTINGGYEDVPWDIFTLVGTGNVVLGTTSQGLVKWWKADFVGTDTITATYVPALHELRAGLRVTGVAAGANATTTPTFNPNSLTAKTIIKGHNQPLLVGDIPGAGALVDLEFNANDKWTLLNPANPVTVAVIPDMYMPGGFSRLKLKNTVGETDQIDIDATSVIVSYSTNHLMLTNINLTVDFAGTNGPNALDTGSLSLNTWYYLYVIAKADGTTAGVGSLSYSSPTTTYIMDYPYYKLVGCVYYTTIDAVDTFRTFYQFGNKINFVYDKEYDRAFFAVLGPMFSWNLVSIDDWVPPTIAHTAHIEGRSTASGIGTAVAWDADGYNIALIANYPLGTLVDEIYQSGSLSVEYLLNPAAPQTIYCWSHAPDLLLGYLFMKGFEIDI